MGSYRQTRSIEASVIDFLNGLFAQEGGWSNITVEKTFKRIYGLPMDINTGAAAVCVRVLTSKHPRIEIGSNSIWRSALVMLDVFATSDGQREDLKDFILTHIKRGVPYYKYTTGGNNVFTKVQTGYLQVTIDSDTPVNFNQDKNQLDVHDRYRHAISLSVKTSFIEE